MTSEIPASIQKQVDEAASIIRKHLGRHLIATYLYGSALDGGLKPESDIDLFVVVNNSLSESNRKQLMTEMLSVSSYPAAHGIRPIEVTVVDARTLKPWVYPPKRELQLGEWLRKDIESGSFESPKADPDLAILITKIRKSSIALHGPSAMEIFDEVPEADLKKALLRVVVDKLIFKEGQAQVFYRQINQGSDDGKSKNKVVNLSEKRESTKMNVKHQSQASVEASGDAFHMSLELFRKSSHNPMDQGWYIGKNGCGSRI